MADKKISQLTALAAANVASATDVLAIVDTSATETKKITAKDLIDGALNGGTANGVLYLNGSKVSTSGSALTFDGTTVLTTPRINITNTGIGATFSSSGGSGMRVYGSSGTNQWDVYLNGANIRFSDNTGGGVVKIDTGAVIDGNVGIGTTSPGAKLEVSGEVRVYPSSSPAQIRFGVSGVEKGKLAVDTSSNMLFETAGTTRATIDSSGNLGLGVTPRAWAGGYKSFDITGPGAIASTASGDTFTQVANGAWFNGTNWIYQYDGIGAARYQMTGPSGGGNHSWYVAGSGTAGNTISSFTQAMTLDASGNLLVGTTSTAFTGRVVTLQTTSASNVITAWNSATSGDNSLIGFFTDGGTGRGSITYNRTAGLVAYNTTSDVRLKDNIANAADSGDKVDAIKVRQFDWKETGNHVDYGFVAQELHAVAPHAVSKPEDEEAMWSVDYSKLVPMLVKEVQSLRKRVAELEAK